MNKSILLTLMLYGALNATNPCTKSDSIVICTDTSLEWQDDSSASSTSKTWQEAIKHCKSLELNGKDDWRLPYINELKSIIDYTKSSPTINSVFANTTSNYYWSITSYIHVSGHAWSVDVGDGYVGPLDKNATLYVRCVR